MRFELTFNWDWVPCVKCKIAKGAVIIYSDSQHIDVIDDYFFCADCFTLLENEIRPNILKFIKDDKENFKHNVITNDKWIENLSLLNL